MNRRFPTSLRRPAGLLSLRALIMLAVLAIFAAPAQLALAATAPMPSLQNTAPVWLGYAVMFILLVMVIGVSIMPSKRSHQD